VCEALQQRDARQNVIEEQTMTIPKAANRSGVSPVVLLQELAHYPCWQPSPQVRRNQIIDLERAARIIKQRMRRQRQEGL